MDKTYTPEQVAAIANMVRALCLCYNTALSYGGKHPVMLRVLDENIPVFNQVLDEMMEVTLLFTGGHVRTGVSIVEPGNAQFSRISQVFNSRSVTGITFLRGLKAPDLFLLVELVARRGDLVAIKGLQAFLDSENVKCIRERRERMGLIDDKEKDAKEAKPAGAGQSAATWQISGDLDLRGIVSDEEKKEEDEVELVPTSATEQVGFRTFVHSVLVEVSTRRTTTALAANRIAAEFERRNQQQLEETRREAAKTIKTLENVRDLMLNELENMKLAAVLVDGRMRVLALNRPASDVLGNLLQIEAGSPLHAFIQSGKERDAITLANGTTRSAHRILSAGSDKADHIMLISIE